MHQPHISLSFLTFEYHTIVSDSNVFTPINISCFLFFIASTHVYANKGEEAQSEEAQSDSPI